MKNEIKDAYERIRPDEDARKRMLENIKTMASDESILGKEEHNMKLKSKHMLRIAAAAAVILIVPTVAYATGLFGLNNVSLGKKQVELPMEETERAEGTEQMKKTIEADMISLQGVTASPEYQACREWMEFLENYDTDGAILSEVGNNPTGFGEEYQSYLCYTQEMADKIDEICEKYNLSKLVGGGFSDDYKSICDEVGIEDIMEEVPENVYIDNSGGYYYSDGTFHMEGMAVITGELACVMDYQIRRSVKGSFDSTVLNIGNINDYEQWNYTTANGESLLLANSSEKALIMAEKEKSFVVVNVLGNITKDSFDVSNEALEELAEMFDFSVIP